MKIYLPVCVAISVLGFSSISVNAMENTSAEKNSASSSLEELVSFNSLSRSNLIATDSVTRDNVEFDNSHSINLSSSDRKLSLENGLRTDYTKIWREGLGEPERNSLQVTLVRF